MLGTIREIDEMNHSGHHVSKLSWSEYRKTCWKRECLKLSLLFEAMEVFTMKLGTLSWDMILMKRQFVPEIISMSCFRRHCEISLWQELCWCMLYGHDVTALAFEIIELIERHFIWPLKRHALTSHRQVFIWRENSLMFYFESKN